MRTRSLPTAIFVSIGSLLLFMMPARAQSVLYVDIDAIAANDGSTWCDAFIHLQDALAAAEASGGTVTEIRVADGIYTPDQGAGQTPGDRDATFQLINGVELLGGYAGCGAANPDERNIAQFETTLSGDLEGNDHGGGDGSDCCYKHPAPGCDDPDCRALVCSPSGLPECCEVAWNSPCADLAALICPTVCNPDIDDNSRHVVTASYTDHTTVLEGFSVTGGNSDESYSDPGFGGGGVHNTSGSPVVSCCAFRRNHTDTRGAGMSNKHEANPLIIQCTFIANTAFAGAGMCNYFNSNPTVRDCAFIANGNPLSAPFGGAGMVNLYSSSPMLVNCAFIGNIAIDGGGLLNDSYSDPIVLNCRFDRNEGFFGGGGMFNTHSDPTVINTILVGNLSPDGGAIYNANYSAPRLINCTIADNVAWQRAGGIMNSLSAAPNLDNCILWGNTDQSGSGESAQMDDGNPEQPSIPIVNYSCIQGGWSGAGGVGVISSDPMFVDAGGENANVRLLPGSPCIDAGDNDALPADSLDLDDDGDTTEPIPLDLDWLARFRDDPDTPDTGNPGLAGPPIVDMGAYENHPDCNENGLPDLLDLANGTSQDCNANGQPDECDVADGTSEDCNVNNVPDECEPDCNENGVADECDITGGMSNDCNGNDIPDECDIADGTSEDTNGDGRPDECEHLAIPAVSEWSLVILTLLLLTVGKVFFGRQRRSEYV